MTESLQIESALRETARRLLSEEKVSLFIGYEKGTLPFRTAPLFLSRAEEAERLVWNPFCTANLAVYLPRLFRAAAQAKGDRAPPVGIVLKGCDLRSVAVLQQERQVDRERLVLVRVACGRMVDRRKAEEALGGRRALGAGEGVDGDVHVVVDDGTEVTLPRADITTDSCLECHGVTPQIPDIVLGAPADGQGMEAARRRVSEFASQPGASRWVRFTQTLSACIRCNACRQACPLCSCATCMFDQTMPRWIGAGNDASDIAIYHLTRALHLAGRCTGCGACERACPLGIDVRLLGRMLCAEVEDLYGYRPGEAVDTAPLLSTFAADDPQEFVTEP